jgi:hypothetical protein
LPDVNVLLALSNPDHLFYRVATKWLVQIQSARFLLCAVTESSFVRLTASPHVGNRKMETAIELLEDIRSLPNRESLPMDGSWLELISPLVSRIHGHRQVTDALLLGLAIRHNVILVTLDQKIQALAGQQFKANLLTLI